MSSWQERIRQAFSERDNARRQAEAQAEAMYVEASRKEAERLERERREKLEGEEEMRRKLRTLQEIDAEGLLKRAREVWGDGKIGTFNVWSENDRCQNPVVFLKSEIKGEREVTGLVLNIQYEDYTKISTYTINGFKRDFLGIEAKGNGRLAIIDAQGFIDTAKKWGPSISPDLSEYFMSRIVKGRPNSEKYDEILGRRELNELDSNVLRSKAEQAILGFCVSRIQSGNLPKEPRR